MTAGPRLAVLNAAHFACHYYLLVFPTAAIAIERERGLDYGAALALGTPLYLCFALGTPLAGWLGDRWDSHRLIGVFFAGCGGAALLTGLAPGDPALMAGLGALGFFAAIYHPVGLALVTRSGGRTGRALALNGVFGNLGLAAATLGTGLLAGGFGWRSAFLVPGIAGVALGAALLLRSPRVRIGVAARSADAAVAETLPPRPVQIRVLGIVLFAALFSGFAFNCISISLPKLLDERLGAEATGLAGIGGYSALVFAVAAFAQLPVGALLDRVGGRPVLAALCLLQATALMVTSSLSGPAVVPAALAGVTFMFAGIPVSGWLLGTHVAAGWRGRAFAAEYLLSLGMSSAAVPAMAAMHLAGHGFAEQFRLFALAVAVVFAAALALPRAGCVAPAS